MSYVKTVWAAGDTITAEKLNKIEDALSAMLNGDAEEQGLPIGDPGGSGLLPPELNPGGSDTYA